MIGIIVLNYNNVDDTIKCVDSIYKNCPYDKYKLCVVDNCSQLSVYERIKNYLSKKENLNMSLAGKCEGWTGHLQYIRSEENVGYAKGNNIGLNHMRNDPDIHYYLILNNDVIITEDILTPLSDYLNNYGNCAVVSPLLYGPKGDIDYECARKEKSLIDILSKITLLKNVKWVKQHELNNRILREHPSLVNKNEIEIDLPSGSCMMFPKKVFEEIGFFDPHTFLYFEEDILSSRIKNIGMKAFLLPKVSCVHLGAGTTSKSPSIFIRECYRNSLLYYLSKYKKISKPLLWYIKFRTYLSLIYQK